MPVPDRRARLEEQSPKVVTGIDFVHVENPDEQDELLVYFIVDPSELTDSFSPTPGTPITKEQITIVSVSGGAAVVVTGVTPEEDPKEGSERNILRVTVEDPGDFSIYRLRIDDPRIDPFFNDVPVNFKAGCDDGLDCKPRDKDCPPEDLVDFPIDYLAKDFDSFRQALLDFATQRYPKYEDRLLPDAGIMMAELMSAVADDLSYQQDRIFREVHFETATQRRSLRRHAHLVDYPLDEGRAATTWLTFTLDAAVTTEEDLPAGTRVWGLADDGEAIAFELGTSLDDLFADPAITFNVKDIWNGIDPHLYDDEVTCLFEGATELVVVGAPFGEDPDVFEPKTVVLRTFPTDPSQPRKSHLLTVQSIEVFEDPLEDPGFKVTRLHWNESDAPPFQMCLLDLKVLANAVPAIAGQRRTAQFSVGPTSHGLEPAVERDGPLDEATCERAPIVLMGLRDTEEGGLAWLGDTREETKPEVRVIPLDPATEPLEPDPSVPQWTWLRTLLNAASDEERFTLDDGVWRRIVAFRRPPGEIAAGAEPEMIHRDYATGQGFSVRFGDGEFGKVPDDGALFEVSYRLGTGTAANLGPDTVSHADNPNAPEEIPDAPTLPAGVLVTNPLDITNGRDPESAEQVKVSAPEAFKVTPIRAVIEEDYEDRADDLAFIQRAGAQFRWTGSWISTFVAADPVGAFALTEDQEQQLEDRMELVRQAGREVILCPAKFVPIDLEITICVAPNAFPAQVKEAVREILVGPGGFFSPDNFTFGDPLRRPALEARIHDVEGVKAVLAIRLRPRGKQDFVDLNGELGFEVGLDKILQLADDPNFPERGSLTILTEGGA